MVGITNFPLVLSVMKVEQKTSEAVLQTAKKININGKEYHFPKPTVATIIMVSELASSLPCDIREEEDILHHVLATAKDMQPLGRIVAVLLLGAKQVQAEEKKSRYLRFLGYKNKVEELANKMLTELSPKELAEVVASALETLDIAFFFGTITSLTRVNVIAPTKKK